MSLLLILLALVVTEPKPIPKIKQIPVSQVWGEGIKDTKDLKTIDKKIPGEPPPEEPLLANVSHPLLGQIKWEIWERRPKPVRAVKPIKKFQSVEKWKPTPPAPIKPIGSAFIVTGKDRTALKNALAAFQSGDEFPRSASQDDDV